MEILWICLKKSLGKWVLPLNSKIPCAPGFGQTQIGQGGLILCSSQCYVTTEPQIYVSHSISGQNWHENNHFTTFTMVQSKTLWCSK